MVLSEVFISDIFVPLRYLRRWRSTAVFSSVLKIAQLHFSRWYEISLCTPLLFPLQELPKSTSLLNVGFLSLQKFKFAAQGDDRVGHAIIIFLWTVLTMSAMFGFCFQAEMTKEHCQSRWEVPELARKNPRAERQELFCQDFVKLLKMKKGRCRAKNCKVSGELRLIMLINDKLWPTAFSGCIEGAFKLAIFWIVHSCPGWVSILSIAVVELIAGNGADCRFLGNLTPRKRCISALQDWLLLFQHYKKKVWSLPAWDPYRHFPFGLEQFQCTTFQGTTRRWERHAERVWVLP